MQISNIFILLGVSNRNKNMLFIRESLCDPLCRNEARVARDHSPWEAKNQVEVDSGRFFFIAENESMMSLIAYVWISAENNMIKPSN